MSALLKVLSAGLARFHAPTEGDYFVTIVGNTPTPVSAEAWPILPTTALSSPTLHINGTATNKTINGTGQNPYLLEFSLGGDSDERPGEINSAVITLSAAGAFGNVSFTINYYRKPDPTTTTTTAKPVRKSAQTP